jgi:hypothetical protein
VCSTTDKRLFQLPNTIDAPAEARAHIQRHLCPEHGRDAHTAAQLAATELATCAVLYGKAPIVLELECGVSQLRVALTHRVAGAPVPEIPIDEDGGLRTALLARLSRSWGVDPTPDGRLLWCCLPTGITPARAEPPLGTRSGRAVPPG